MSYRLGSAAPVTVLLIAAAGDRPAVSATFNPQPSPLSLRAGRAAVAAVLRDGLPNGMERAGDAFTHELIRHNIRAWEGIGDESDAPIEPTHDREIRDVDGNLLGVELGTISAFLAEPRLVEAADREWLSPWVQRDAEKNGFAPSPSGTSEGATPEGDTASLSAKPDSTDGAETTKPARRRAPTKSTSRKRTPAKPSGS